MDDDPPVRDITTVPQEAPPPIPDELRQPEPVKLVITRPAPTITIEPTPATQVNQLIATGKQLPPVQPTIVPTQPIQPLRQPVIQKSVTLDILLKKGDTETDDFFAMRSTYSKVASTVFKGQINLATAVLIGRMAANKCFYGVIYPEESDRVLRYIDSQILNQ